MIDLGLAKRFRDSKRKIHIPQSNNRGLTGTARYASINAHLGVSKYLGGLSYFLTIIYSALSS